MLSLARRQQEPRLPQLAESSLGLGCPDLSQQLLQVVSLRHAARHSYRVREWHLGYRDALRKIFALPAPASQI